MKKTTLFFLLTAFTCISFAQQITLIDFGLSAPPDRTTAGNWNNVTNSSTLSSFTDLIDNSGLSTGEILTLTDAFDDEINGSGTTSPDASLPFPDTATRDNFFGESVLFTDTTPSLEPTGGFTLSRLEVGKYYSFKIFASRMGVTDNRETLYTVTGNTGPRTATLDAANNTANVATIFNVQPNVSGEITIQAETGVNNTNPSGFYYLGAIEMTKTDTTAQIIDAQAADNTVECDGAGNTATLNAWLAANGGATAAATACSNVIWSNDFTALSDDCGATGSVTVTFTATDDCLNTSTTTATFTIEDTTAPTIDTVAADSTVVCDGAGNTADINAWLAANGGAAASDNCGGVTWSNDFVITSLIYDCGITEFVTVTFTATDDCSNSSTTSATFTIESTPLATDSFSLNGVVNIYPNPSSEYVTISISLKEAAQVKMNIYDLNGKIVKSILNEEISAGSFIKTWNRSNVASGIYILEIDANGRKHNSKLILK